MKKFIISAVCIIMFVSAQQSARALDTTECFSVGAFTDYEIYTHVGFGPGGIDGGLEFLIGSGITENLSLAVVSGVSAAGNDVELSGIGLGFIWTPVNLEKFAFDVMPGFSFDANSTEGRFGYPGFNAFTASLVFEFNCMALKKFQPYMHIGFEGSYNYKDEDDSSFAFPIDIGFMIPVNDKTEFFLQLGWAPADESAWLDVDREIAVGVNVVAAEGLEVISQAGYEFNEKEFVVSIGLIYAL